MTSSAGEMETRVSRSLLEVDWKLQSSASKDKTGVPGLLQVKKKLGFSGDLQRKIRGSKQWEIGFKYPFHS